MKNTLGDLNNYLFEQLERLMDDSQGKEGLETEIHRAKAVTGVAQAIIHSGEISIKAARIQAEYGKDTQLPALMEAK